MEAFLWAARTRDSFAVAWPVLTLLFVFASFSYVDYPIVIGIYFWRLLRGGRERFVARAAGQRPPILIVIPSLLRNEEEFAGITTTMHSCASNGYPGELVLVSSIDGINDEPELVARMQAWVDAKHYPPNVHVYIGGTQRRLGKMMAVEAGVHCVQEKVAAGAHEAFPPIYFSIDGDGELGEQALERMVDRLTTPHLMTGNLRRVVAGKCCIRPELFWQGVGLASVRSFFTVGGQIYRQVAREFLVSNIPRFNLRPKPQICIPGGLYCTWSEILLAAPRFMGFMATIKTSQWLGWWLGQPPPCFSQSEAMPLPEALTGPSDDTCISFLAQMATWREGKLSLDAPRTPLHALGRMLRSYLVERTPQYAPEARVFTYTPPTLNGIWVQRVRWNASRFECSFRFRKAFAFHWEAALPVSFHWFLLGGFFQCAFYYFYLPYHVVGTTNALFAFLLGYFTQVCITAYFTFMALLVEKDRRRFWPVFWGVPLSPLYSIGINFFAGLTGIVKDLALFGNHTKFAPEWTFVKGGTTRVALLYRVRRYLSLCVRAIVVGDVPWGTFWFGWRETKWTTNGYEGWTTGKRPRIFPSWRDLRAQRQAKCALYENAAQPK